MEYRRFDKTIIVRLDKGEEILAQIQEIAQQEHIRLAQRHGAGGNQRLYRGRV